MQKLDWSLGIERFLQLNGAPNFFTNQTITHLVMHANGASPLDPAKYVLQLDDQTVYRDRYAGDGAGPAPLRQSSATQILDYFVAPMNPDPNEKPLRILAIVNLPWDARLGAARVWIELSGGMAEGRPCRRKVLSH